MTDTPSPPASDHLPENTPNQAALSARIGCSALILIAAIGIAVVLVKTKSKPPAAEERIPELLVNTRVVSPTHVVATITAYGRVSALRSADIAPEVGGLIIETPRPWQEGDLVRQGELLFRLDERDYQAAVSEAKAQVARAKAMRTQLTAQHQADQQRLVFLERSKVLAQKEFERTQRLYEKENIGSINAVEAAEQAYNQAENQRVLTQQSLDVYPARLEEAEQNLLAAESGLNRAELNLDRCRVSAPFSGRITMAALETGQFVQPGRHVLTLSDDRNLELRAPIDATDLRLWLPFQVQPESSQAWFAPLEPRPVTLSWTEGAEELAWTGRLDRVVSFDPETRTAMVAIRIDGHQANGSAHGIPLTPGMFCQVVIPGNELSGVFALPREAVTFNNQVYLAVSNRLESVSVRIRRSEADTVFVDQGLNEGDEVILTRLVAPMEGATLSIVGD